MQDELAILGGQPVRSKPFRYEPAIGNEEKKAVLENTRRYQENWKKYSKSIF